MVSISPTLLFNAISPRYIVGYNKFKHTLSVHCNCSGVFGILSCTVYSSACYNTGYFEVLTAKYVQCARSPSFRNEAPLVLFPCLRNEAPP